MQTFTVFIMLSIDIVFRKWKRYPFSNSTLKNIAWCYLALSRDDRRTAGEEALVLACERVVHLPLVDEGAGGAPTTTLFIGNGERTTVAFLLLVTLGDWVTVGMAFLLLVNLCKGDAVGIASIDEAVLSGSKGISSVSLLLVALGK